MNASPPAFRLEQGSHLVPLAAGTRMLTWNDAVRSEDLGNGHRVTVIDWLPAEDEAGQVEGPPTLSISLFLEGAGSFSLDNGPALDVASGSLFLFHASRPTRGLHRIRGGRRMLGVDFRFAPDVLEAAGFRLPGRFGGGPYPGGSVDEATLLRAPLTDAFQRIARQTIGCPMRGPARRTFFQAKALEVLAHVIDLGEGGRMPTAGLSSKDRLRIRQAAEIIRSRYDEPWTIASLARAAGINERKLKQGFRQVLGLTVHTHLQATRITAALDLIARDGTTVTDAALAVGYSNPSHFAKIFRDHVGQSPGRWRRTQG